jgi:hypothetical protein
MNAKEARSIVDSHRPILVQSELKVIYEDIKRVAKQGGLCHSINYNLYHENVKILENDGYTITNDQGYTTIYW